MPAKADYRLEVYGVAEARARLSGLATTAAGFRRTVVAGSARAYAYGQETGRHRSGKLARRSGPTYFLTFAAQEVLPQVDADLVEGLRKSLDGMKITGLGLVRRIGRWVNRVARQGAPKRSGRLRRSLRTVVRRA